MSYSERILRYRIMRHVDLPEEHKKSYREDGIDPDTIWNVVWSFNNLEHAEIALSECNDNAASFETYKLVDNGEETIVEREEWF